MVINKTFKLFLLSIIFLLSISVCGCDKELNDETKLKEVIERKYVKSIHIIWSYKSSSIKTLDTEQEINDFFNLIINDIMITDNEEKINKFKNQVFENNEHITISFLDDNAQSIYELYVNRRGIGYINNGFKEYIFSENSLMDVEKLKIIYNENINYKR